MSITLGNYFVETKKTVGALPVGSDNIIAETPCDESINLATVQPVWKQIHEYTETLLSIPVGRLFEIPPTYLTLPDDVFADGYDYEVEITLNYVGASPLLNIITQRFSYTVGGVNWFQNVLSGDKIIMNENNCGGSYANTTRAFNIGANDVTPFFLNYTFIIKQLIPATIEIELCGGGITTNQTELKVVSDVIQVYVDNEGEPVEVNSDKRDSDYDPADLGFGELAKMPKSCVSYSVYYIGSLFSSPYIAPNERTYFIDLGIYEIKINIPKVPPQILDFKLYDGVAYVFDELSDANGLIDWMTWTTNSGVITSLELWNGLIPETYSFNQYVYFKYDLATYECPCSDCGTDCGDITVIFHQNCGASYPLKFNLMIQEGKYDIEGETFTQGGGLITPITKIKANYDFVISEYSDETYLLLMELIADNILIEVVDNIDTGNPTTQYYINKEAFAPNWNFNSKLGSLVLPVIKKDSIRTSRRNCCN
ncbi:MAG: hypothetical protein ACK459_15165 [Akkermansiaceae bacterium]|jgi:hypothetical protein